MPPVPAPADLQPSYDTDARVPLDVATVARQFDRRAARFGRFDAIVREIERRMIDRLAYIRIEPKRVLDVGCGAGVSRAALLERYPNAQWIGVDVSLRMLRAADGARTGPAARVAALLARWRGRTVDRICADAAQLPLAGGTVDLLFSNLMLHWHPAPHRVFPEFRRVLAEGGLLMFSCFGPDTLAELRAACAEALPRAAPMPFIDMHDFGDMLASGGFATPVMDAERLTLTYRSPHELLREAAMLGGNPRRDRAPGLPSGRAARALVAALERRRGADGRIPLTFEVAYGHAWKPAERATAKMTGGVAAVPISRLRDELRHGRS